jgi:hypothetical protein
MASDIGELILKIGKRPSYRIQKTAGKLQKFKNGEYRINYDAIVITECRAQTSTVFEKEIVPYHGMVYDLTLDRNAIMYVRRKGKCFWGSNCRCYAQTIMADEDEFVEQLNQDPDNPIEPKGEIKDVPDKFNEWIDKNKERSRGWNSLPQFVKDNKQYAPQMFNATKYTPFEKKFMRHSSTHLAVERMSSMYYQKKYPDITSIELGAIHHYTRSNTMAYRQLNKQLVAGETDPFNTAFGGLVSSGLKKLPDFKGIVYRGSILTKEQLAPYLKAQKMKGTITHKFFTSGSKRPEIADTFQNLRRLRKEEIKCAFVIKSKRGKYVDDISEFNGKFARTKQQEVIFDKDAKFNLISITEGESNTLKILLEEI